MLSRLLTALSFLTILPVRPKQPTQPGDLGRAATLFPFAGLLIGLVLAAGWWGFSHLLPTLPSAVLTVSLWAALTGGLHLDGLADCCDGLFSARPVERRLEIMRDSRLGAFGVTGLVLFLILKVALVFGLSSQFGFLGLLLAPAVARFFLLPAGRVKPARAEGLGFDFSYGLGRWGMAISGLLLLACLAAAGWQFPVAGLFAALAGGGVLLLAWKRIGGLTGDVLGMLVEVSELAFLLFLNLRLA